MLDCRGKRLRAGDRVAYSSTNRGLMLGELKFDPEDRQAYHIILDDQQMYYPQKPWRAARKTDYSDSQMISLTAYVEDEINERLQG